MDSAVAKHISECYIKPKYEVEESKQPYYLAPSDLLLLSIQYIQKGLLFTKPSHLDDEEYSTNKLLDNLKDSLSIALVHFYPLAGRLVTQVSENRHECLIYVDSIKGRGARFIYATLDMTVSDILSPTDVPLVVQSFFDLNGAVNHDGHTIPLLSVQVTELLDGVFIGCSANHAILDGTSYWHFWNTWSEIHQANGKLISVSRPPILKRWTPDGSSPAIHLPFTHPDEFVIRCEPPELRVRIFHVSSESISRLKAKANQESNTNNISSFQALAAFVWRSIIVANRLQDDEKIICSLPANIRPRLNPPLPQEYFGNSFLPIRTSTTAGELVHHGLGWAALLLHHSVVNCTDKTVRDFLESWVKSPHVYHPGAVLIPTVVKVTSSPRFDVFGNEFGLGKAVAVRSGTRNIFLAKITPSCEGGGNVDLEIGLPPEAMRVLETDEEFLTAVSLQLKLRGTKTMHCQNP